MNSKNNGYETTSSSTVQKQSTLTEVKVKPDISLDGELNISDYVRDVPVSPQTAEDLAAWATKQREVTRKNLAMWLVKVFGFSLGGTVLLAGTAAFVPTADKPFIKEIIPLVITPQATLLGVALTFYFTAKEEK